MVEEIVEASLQLNVSQMKMDNDQADPSLTRINPITHSLIRSLTPEKNRLLVVKHADNDL